MALQEIHLKPCDKQTNSLWVSQYCCCRCQLIQKQLLMSIDASLFFMTSPSPSDVALLISLDVCHRAVAIAKCFSSHQIIATVTGLPGFVKVGKGRHYIC